MIRLRREHVAQIFLCLTLISGLSVIVAGCSNSGMVSQPMMTSLPNSSPVPTSSIKVIISEESGERLAQEASQTPDQLDQIEKNTDTPASSQTQISSSPTPKPTLRPDSWKELPVIPIPSERIVEIYKRGLELGNNPYAFSKVGDCGSTPAWFLGDFDRGEEFYDLGEYEFLSPVILAYHGSFERTSLAARSGFTASSLLTSLWTNLDYCGVEETPLECEFRLHKPVIAFITLGTNDIWLPEQFEPQMRKIIEYSIEQGVVPILATKADDAEGDGRINATIANLAMEYDIPLWNYWLAVQPLPNHGLQEDQAHLTWGRNFFDKPENLNKAWPVRNLNALQVLYEVWKKVTGQNGE